MNKSLKRGGLAFAVATMAITSALPLACGGGDSGSSGLGGAGAIDGGLGGAGAFDAGKGGTGGVAASGGGGFGGGVGGAGGSGGGNPCPGATLCGTVCTQTEFDPNNCGTCGKVCATGEVCSAGQCGSTCGGGSVKCGTTCTNTQTDPQNCGSCGTACASGEVCSAGQCGLSCVGGTTKCGTVCTNTQTDPANCGTCGTACATGEVCSAGQCGLQCVGGTTKCGTSCVNTQTDPTNCGTCGTACAAGEVCSAGQCGIVCTGGTTKCGTSCVNTQTDAANCGTCGTACPTGQVCSAGQCGLNCSGGSTKCGTICTNTQTDPANCGTCGTACKVGEVCSAGLCAGICGGGLTKCGNNCVNLQTDASNCGTCGNACAPGATCVTGQCVQCNSATTDCDGDGWLVSEGDCCDKPGLCGNEPKLVNPGAVEVKGNGVDDNCNGLVDLFDKSDTLTCDTGLSSNSSTAGDYAKAIDICRTTTLNPAQKKDKTWGLISAELLRADGTALPTTSTQRSIRSKFGTNISALEGTSMAVLSSGIASDATQTSPGPNGGAPGGINVSTSLSSSVNISTCTSASCIKDWFTTANPPLKAANALPVAPSCGSGTAGTPTQAQDSVMLKLQLRAPTNARAFSFNSYFFSAEYPEYVCTSYNDQLVALVDTPSGTPSPIANPIDKNLMTFVGSNGQKYPIGINIANGTNLFSVCESQAANPGCWDTSVNAASCSLGITDLAGTGYEKSGSCRIGGGTYWLTTAGNVIPGQIVEIRIVIWDVGDQYWDSATLIDGFTWLPNATLPGTG